jgi:UPF0716 protein FxsA
MIRRLILLFILVPLGELALLIQLGRWIGLWPTLGLIIATGMIGAALASREGLRAWHAFQLDLQEGRVPGRPILDGLSIFAGGALLLTPGLVTDLIGFALLVRPTRRWLQDRVVGRLGGAFIRQGQVYVGGAAGFRGRESGAAEGPTGREIEEPGPK